ncbi:hypothetical protein J6590_047583 [Homalodisca vitripennis]|nr:hypothetical protein J6590_047583 [Homalodisca vitripennis]
MPKQAPQRPGFLLKPVWKTWKSHGISNFQTRDHSEWVCSICYKSIPQKQSLFGASNNHNEASVLSETPPAILQSAKSPDIRFRPYELSKPSPSPKVSHKSPSPLTVE